MILSRAFREFDPSERLYCCIATAVIGSGVLAAGASIYGANTAATAQTNAANSAIQNQQQMYANNQNVLNPFIQGGNSAIPQLQSLLNPSNGGTLNQLLNLTGTNGTPAQTAALANTPGYQFSLTQGQNSVNNALAARGLAGSGGAVAKGAANYAEGLAGNTWQSVVQALQGTYNSQLSGTQGLVNTGEGAAGALAGVGTNTANSITGSITGAGNAQAAAANATGSALASGANSLSTAALLQQLTGSGSSGLYGPSQIASIGQMPAASATDAQANAYGIANGLV